MGRAGGEVFRILSEIKELQGQLEDYKVLSSMTTPELEILLAELVREENAVWPRIDRKQHGRKMRIQNVLSERL